MNEAFNQSRYLDYKMKVKLDIDLMKQSPYDFMIEYEQCIIKEDYERAKAITEVLEPLGFNTADTHKHIKQLNY